MSNNIPTASWHWPDGEKRHPANPIGIAVSGRPLLDSMRRIALAGHCLSRVGRPWNRRPTEPHAKCPMVGRKHSQQRTGFTGPYWTQPKHRRPRLLITPSSKTWLEFERFGQGVVVKPQRTLRTDQSKDVGNRGALGCWVKLIPITCFSW